MDSAVLQGPSSSPKDIYYPMNAQSGCVYIYIYRICRALFLENRPVENCNNGRKIQVKHLKFSPSRQISKLNITSQVEEQNDKDQKGTKVVLFILTLFN